MTALQRLARAELFSFCSLVVVAALVAALFAYLSSAGPSVLLPRDSAQIGFLGTLLIGFLPVAVLCAPAYAWLSHRGWANWPTVLLLGAWPGLVWLIINVEFGFFTLACGLAVAVLTHSTFLKLAEP